MRKKKKLRPSKTIDLMKWWRLLKLLAERLGRPHLSDFLEHRMHGLKVLEPNTAWRRRPRRLEVGIRYRDQAYAFGARNPSRCSIYLVYLDLALEIIVTESRTWLCLHEGALEDLQRGQATGTEVLRIIGALGESYRSGDHRRFRLTEAQATELTQLFFRLFETPPRQPRRRRGGITAQAARALFPHFERPETQPRA